MKMTDAGFFERGSNGSRISIMRRPLSASSFFQLSIVRKYHGAGSVKSSLNPAHDVEIGAFGFIVGQRRGHDHSEGE